MHDQRTGVRASFGFKDASDGLSREGVGAESIDGFGREGDQASGAEEFGRVTKFVVSRINHWKQYRISGEKHIPRRAYALLGMTRCEERSPSSLRPFSG